MSVPKRKLSVEDYELLAQFRWSLRQFLRFSECAAREAGLTPQQHQALLAIKGFGGKQPILIGELADRLQILHHSAVGLADRLGQKGYVKRLPDQSDRRRVHLVLTPRGETILETLSAAHREQLSAASPTLMRVLQRLSE
jgi:DNA-binding MarR family transcriptional regulator